MKHLARSPVRLLVIGTAACGLMFPVLGGRLSWAAAENNAMQVLADATVIDAECRTTNTMFGSVFRYGEEHGIHVVEIMPLGRRRQEFETAFNRRLTATAHDQICGSLQARYLQAFPDWFRAR